jgi:hypothetical protein
MLRGSFGNGPLLRFVTVSRAHRQSDALALAFQYRCALAHATVPLFPGLEIRFLVDHGYVCRHRRAEGPQAAK